MGQLEHVAHALVDEFLDENMTDPESYRRYEHNGSVNSEVLDATENEEY